MAARNEHKFHFTALQIAEAAKAEAEYHERRRVHWRERLAKAVARVKATARLEMVERPVTGGKQFDMVIEYGDPDALQELHLAAQKLREHQQAAQRFRTDQRVYETQNTLKHYELDTDDVHHFRLGGQPREEVEEGTQLEVSLKGDTVKLFKPA